jgi:hypothetical protein
LVFSNATVTTVIQAILGVIDNPKYSSWYMSGSIAPTDTISITISWETVLSALQRVLALCNAEYDLDEATSLINIYKTMGAANSVFLRSDKNIKSLQVTYFNRDVINKMFGVGGSQPPSTIAGARHVVSAYNDATGLLTVSGNKLVPENDSWNTDYEVYFVTGAEAGNAFTITDSAHTTTNDTLTIDTAQTIAIGDKFVIRTTGHVEVDFIRAGASITAYGTVEGVYKNGAFAGGTNLVETPDLSGAYAGGAGDNLCADWTKEGTPTIDENTTADYFKYGTKSQRVQGDADLEGVSQVVTVTANRYYRVLVNAYITSGTVKVTASDGTNTIPVSKTGTGWQRYEIFEKFVATSLTVKILQDGAGTSDFYVDSVQATEGAMNYSFNSNCDSLDLWHETFDKLITVKDPPIEYRASFVDLYAMEPGSYPYDQVSLGDTLIIYDSTLDISNVTARLKEIRKDEFNLERTEHTISNL